MQGSIELPGHNGGANWGSSAINPTKGTFFIVSKELPTLLASCRPARRPDADGGGAARARRRRRAGPKARRAAVRRRLRRRRPSFQARRRASSPYNSPYDFMNNYANGMSAIGPPWSQLTAYDLNTGKISGRFRTARCRACPAEKPKPAATRRAAASRRRPAACSSSARHRTAKCAPTIRTPARCCGRWTSRRPSKACRPSTKPAGASTSSSASAAGAGCSRRGRHGHRRATRPGPVHGVRAAQALDATHNFLSLHSHSAC